jgi:hypothetical protein
MKAIRAGLPWSYCLRVSKFCIKKLEVSLLEVTLIKCSPFGWAFCISGDANFQFVIDGKAKGSGLCNKPSILSTARTDEGSIILTRSQKKTRITKVIRLFFLSSILVLTLLTNAFSLA